MGASVYSALRKRYPEGECILLEEVSDTTGGRNRSADFMIINLWPSRGLSITGIERKSFRGDWLNELKNPAKQEPIYKFCDYFYLLTDKDNVAKIEEIPETWGWVHFDGKKLKTMKDAPKLVSTPVTRPFLCSMLRRAAAKDGFVHISSMEEAIQLRIEEAIRQQGYEKDRKGRAYDEIKKAMDEFQEKTGIDIMQRGWYFNNTKVGDAVNRIMRWEVKSESERMQQIKNVATSLLEEIDKKIEDVIVIDTIVQQVKNENTI